MGLALVGLVLSGALWIGVDAILDRYATLLEADAAPAKEWRAAG